MSKVGSKAPKDNMASRLGCIAGVTVEAFQSLSSNVMCRNIDSLNS